MRYLKFLLLLLLLAAIVSTLPISAQGELLVNPGLEEGSFGPYTTRRGGEFPIYLPNSWNFWTAGATGEYLNRSERMTIFPHPGPDPAPKEGSRALNISCGFVTCTVAIYQQVAVQPNTPIQASAWAQVKACNPPPNGTTCGSAVESGAQTRIGIDPNGGTDPNESDIVWSGWVQPHDNWLQMTTGTTTTGTTATIYLYSTQSSPAGLNRTYWDQVSLSGAGGSGTPGATAVPPTATPIPEVPFVSPQEPQPDGSIVHSVNPGDTLDSIAFAYGVTRSELLQLNNLASGSILQIGQKILVREAQAAPPTATSEPATPASDVVAQAPTPTTEAAPPEDESWREIFPALTVPEGATENTALEVQRQGSTAEGQRTLIHLRRISTSITADVLMNDYNTQLAALGWQLITGATGENFAWSSWTFSTEDGITWGGTLYISASPTTAGEYNITLLIEEGFFTG